MLQSQARVETPNASRYLIQLCKHFAHKIPVEYDTRAGRAEFPFGLCTMEAYDGQLFIRCEGEDEACLGRVQSVLQEHLEGFAFREKPTISWKP
jgi:uncharacterized protein